MNLDKNGLVLNASERLQYLRPLSAFEFFGGVPVSILYDNTKIAVARILGDGRRKRTRVFSELVSHYLFTDRFGRPGKGNDKGKVEGMVGYMDRAGWHRTPKLRLPENLTIILLTSRAPELNPVENIWQYIRQNWLSNRVFENYDAIIEAATKAWNNLITQPQTITSIGSRQWISVARN